MSKNIYVYTHTHTCQWQVPNKSTWKVQVAKSEGMVNDRAQSSWRPCDRTKKLRSRKAQVSVCRAVTLRDETWVLTLGMMDSPCQYHTKVQVQGLKCPQLLGIKLKYINFRFNQKSHHRNYTGFSSHWPLFLAQPAGPARNVGTRLCWLRWAACSRSQGQNQLAIQNLLICSDHATAVQSINLEAVVLQEDAQAGTKLTKMFLSFVKVPDPYWWGHLCLKLWSLFQGTESFWLCIHFPSGHPTA